MSKKPWIWPEWKSTESTRFAPGGLEHVGDEFGGDRLATGGLSVLSGVAVVRDDRGDALGRRALGGVDHDELFHHRVVDRRGVRLDDEDVRAADRLVEAAVDLAVGELAQVGLGQAARPSLSAMSLASAG